MNKKEFLKSLKLRSTSKSDLNTELKKIPAKIFFYGDKQTLVEKEIDRLELKLGVIEAKIYLRFKNSYKEKGLSERHLTHLLNSNSEIKELREKMNGLKDTLRQVKLKIKSLMLHYEVVQNIGHNVRNEKNSISK